MTTSQTPSTTRSLRVGLTGGLGSGKSTVAAMLALHGAHILSADEIARSLMQPGTPVFAAIANHFGPHVLTPEGTLDRSTLSRLAFQDGRVEELNAIVHPAAITRQATLTEEMMARDPDAVVVVESALIFETTHGNNWRSRFDRLILVAAPDSLKIERFVTRSLARNPAADPEALAHEAGLILHRQISDAAKAPQCDFVLENRFSLPDLQAHVDRLWLQLSTSSDR